MVERISSILCKQKAPFQGYRIKTREKAPIHSCFAAPRPVLQWSNAVFDSQAAPTTRFPLKGDRHPLRCSLLKKSLFSVMYGSLQVKKNMFYLACVVSLSLPIMGFPRHCHYYT